MSGAATTGFGFETSRHKHQDQSSHTPFPRFQRFYYEIYYKHLDPSRSLEVHADCWLGDLQVGQAAEILQQNQIE